MVEPARALVREHGFVERRHVHQREHPRLREIDTLAVAESAVADMSALALEALHSWRQVIPLMLFPLAGFYKGRQ